MSPRRSSAWTWRTWAFAALGVAGGLAIDFLVVFPLLHAVGWLR